MKEVAKIHDHFLKAILAKPDTAGTLLRERLPEEIAALLTPDPPELVEGSFIDGEFREHLTDRLYRVNTVDGLGALIYTLLEHKSSPDRKVAWQLHRYMTRILEQWVRENPNWEHLPAVICVVIHHGATAWTIPNEFRPLIAGNEALRPYLANFKFVVVDLGQIEDGHLSANPRLRVGLLTLKYVFRKNEQFGILRVVGSLLAEAPDFLYQVVLYIIHTYDDVNEAAIEALIRLAKPEEEIEMMSQFARDVLAGKSKWVAVVHQQIRQEALQEGLQEGQQKGRQEGEGRALLRQLQRRFGPVPDWVTARIAEADQETLELWLDRVLDAASLQEVFK